MHVERTYEMMSIDRAIFDYQPYPIGIASPVFEKSIYENLCSEFPPIESFKDVGNYGEDGNKYGLSRSYNPQLFENFLNQNKSWGDFDRYISSGCFVESVIKVLNENFLKLGLEKYSVGGLSRNKILWQTIKSLIRLKPYEIPKTLKTRWEFSMLPGIGGASPPHTDHPSKVVTLVVPMCMTSEWDSSYGGGTAVVMPKDAKKIFNQINEPLESKYVDIVKVFEFKPNQCLIFIRTYNSWHAVLPTAAPYNNIWRRSVNINLVLS